MHLGNGLLAGGLWLPAYLTVPRHATPQQHDNDHALHKVAQLVGATGTAATSPLPLPAAAASNPAAAAHPRRLLRPLLLLLQPDERDKGTPDKWIWRHPELIRLTSKLVGGNRRDSRALWAASAGWLAGRSCTSACACDLRHAVFSVWWPAWPTQPSLLGPPSPAPPCSALPCPALPAPQAPPECRGAPAHPDGPGLHHPHLPAL